jgi:hypothetical protein
MSKFWPGVRAKKTGRREGRWGRFLPARGRKIEFSLFCYMEILYINSILQASF